MSFLSFVIQICSRSLRMLSIFFFFFFLRTQSTSCGHGGFVFFFWACIRSSLCRCVVCEGLSCACVCVRVCWDAVFRFLHVVKNMFPRGNLHRSSWLLRERTRAGSHLVFTLGKKRWQPVRWKVNGRRRRFIKSRDGFGWGVSRSCNCNFTLMIHYRWKMN